MRLVEDIPNVANLERLVGVELTHDQIPTIEITLPLKGTTAYHYELTGSARVYDDFDGRRLRNVHLAAGDVAIFRIDP